VTHTRALTTDLLAPNSAVFEINEAFASQCLYCIRALGIPDAKVNPLGGAIALGHPLGATGTRQVVTMMHHLRRTGQRYGVVSMCVGTGMGAAAVFENPDYTTTTTTTTSDAHPSSRL
jgi:acetyl-CoA acetyltransferase